MDIAAIDSSATLGRSWLHRATPVAKLWAFAFVLTAAIVSWNVLVLASITIVLLAVSMTAHLRPGLLLPLALYPAVFAAVFAFSAAPDVLTGITIVLKAITAALAAIMLVLSTPYPQVFAPLQRLLPAVVGDALLMTYRSLFLLLDKFGNLLTAVRLRSGFATGQPVRSARAATRALGGVLLYAIDLSQRDHDIMRLRGYEGRLRVTPPPRTQPAVDAALVAGAFLVAASSIGWRVFSAALNPFSWLAPASAFTLLLLAFVASRRTR